TATNGRYPALSQASGSLDVLDLLPDPLKFLFHFHHLFHDRDIGALGPDRVDLPIHFLQKKVELPSRRALLLEELPEMGAMRLEPDAPLGAIEPVREDGDFLSHPLLRDLPLLEEQIHPLAELVARVAEAVGRALADLRHALPDRLDPRF